MKYTFTKRQLRLVETEDNINSNPAVLVQNTSKSGDASTANQDISNALSKAPTNSPLVVKTSDYNKNYKPNNNSGVQDSVTTIKKSPQAASQAQKLLAQNDSNMTGTIRIESEVNNLEEVATFNKKELDKFLETL